MPGVSKFDQRAEMVSLAIVGQPLFRMEPIERDLPPPSYTVATLAALKANHPAATFHLVVGADCLPDLHKWHAPQELVRAAQVVAVPRPGVPLWSAAEVAASLGIAASEVSLRAVECPLIDIASRDIRKRCQNQQTIRYLVPRAVEEYIREKGLYANA
jgi:nicotinate-nucleotide adenylyltransferase